MASHVGRLPLLASVGLLAAAALALTGPLIGTARASACAHFGNTAAQKLSHAQAGRSIRCLLNRARHRHGLQHLGSNDRLKRAAQRHTTYMTRHRCFSHRCAGEPSLVARLERVNYIGGGLRYWSVGENIAWGGASRGTPKAIVNAWMHSPPHRANILSPQFLQVGVGFERGYPGGKQSDGGTYTTDFGMRKR
jgi:uncharacterized protein YkwD